MKHYLFKDRDGQTPLPPELHSGLKIRTIQTIGELDEYEEDNVVQGLAWLEKQRGDACRYEFWLKLHKRLFGKVWKWAGEIRNHELNNPDFKLPHEIWPELYLLENDLNYWFSSSPLPEKEIAARFHERIETIHPFANGNGRFGRILTQQICTQHSNEVPTWGSKFANDPAGRRKRYVEALIVARYNGDYAGLIEIMFS